jgi:hypothetical protein
VFRYPTNVFADAALLVVNCGDMPALNSSVIAWIDYDPTTGSLQIAFQSGRIYTLRRVPESRYIGLLTASSPGRYFNLYLRGRY